MKVLPTAGYLFSGVTIVRAIALSSFSPSTLSNISSTPTETEFPSTPEPTPTEPATSISSGGFLMAGVYTTCLTVTFAAPTGDPFGDIGSAALTASTITVNESTDAPTSTSFSPNASADPLSSPVDSQPTPTPEVPDPDPDPTAESVVFTTCLVFLPMPTATPTQPDDPTDGTNDS
ncbi:hypothetical protein C8R44DRAFT_987264 [Mycena epipterygia]|nr:hypothetical protein C8R44DRAFT_987264 [Mycena epipterygia]